MVFLNFTKTDLEYVSKVLDEYVGGTKQITDEYIQHILYRSYRLYAHKFKDSHRAILKYKLAMKGHMLPYQIADKFGIEEKNIYSRWRNTIIRRLSRYIIAAVIYDNKMKLSEFDFEAIVAVCDLSKRAVDTMSWFGIDTYDELLKFIETYKPEIHTRVRGTNFNEVTYRELYIAEALLRKEFGKN